MSATASISVTVIPAQKPVIRLQGSQDMFIDVGTPFIDPSATVSDSIDGDLTAWLRVIGDVNTSRLGAYVLTYSLPQPDTQGLFADNKTRTVRVVDREPPV